MEVAVVVATGLVFASAALCLWSVIRADSLAKLIVGLDLLLLVTVLGLGIHAAWTRRTTYLDVMIVAALLAFVGTSAVARFIERQGGG